MSGHLWFQAKFLGYESCKNCGIIRRADGKNSPCKGVVKVVLRCDGHTSDCSLSQDPNLPNEGCDCGFYVTVESAGIAAKDTRIAELEAQLAALPSRERIDEMEAKIACIDHAMTSAFHIGDRVEKFTGDYQLAGEVRAVFVTRWGRVRLVVEHPAGFCHIYSEANLRLLEDAMEPSQ